MTRETDIRKEILFQLIALRPLASSCATMARQARKAGLIYSEAELRKEAEFLVGLGKLQKVRGSAGEMNYAATSQTILEAEDAGEAA
jgi:hypothetical protein